MPSHPPPKSNYSEVRKAEQVERDAAQEAADQRRKAAKEKADRDAALRAKADRDKNGRQNR
ncbi:MAG: hypothetical protein IPG03_01760 [Candidatus Microthrix sp.]|nr:hypothetical protein [Candidatus Microthrix sp.]MBK6501124.1 hypothetical protein [Candidatus Microthrix sp.]